MRIFLLQLIAAVVGAFLAFYVAPGMGSVILGSLIGQLTALYLAT